MDDDVRVVLLDEQGRPYATATKAEVHGSDTPLHLAFSCYLFGDDGRVLITRRALRKRSWPGVWTNSFCGHPLPEETWESAIERHARLELGAGITDITVALLDFRYTATDPEGVVENEVCPVFTARLVGEVAPSPDEVLDWRWVDPAHLVSVASTLPALLSPWSALQIPMLAAAGWRSGTDTSTIPTAGGRA